MYALLLIAAFLALLLAVAHSYLGERYILIRLLRRENLPKVLGGIEFTRQTLRFAWHLTSVAWAGFAVLIIQVGSSRQPEASQLGAVVTLVFAISGLVTLVASRGRHLAWPLFLAIAGLVWWGSR